ncbi:MAG: hypothetical protein C4297_04145 [Gemmataceae bacterium]
MQAVTLNSNLAREEFMRLLITQLKNQNPLNPISDTDFATQLAQFSMLEGIEKLNNSFAGFVASERLLGASSLIGKRVTVPSMEDAVARVEAVRVQSGDLHLITDKGILSLSDVTTITS